MADAFLPAKRPTDTVIRHLNDDPSDNRVENLARGTKSDNGQDATRNDKWNLREGVANGRTKLTEADVREIRRLRKEDPNRWTHQALADKFIVSCSTIQGIVNGKTWRHVV
jgi:hypothetical protein